MFAIIVIAISLSRKPFEEITVQGPPGGKKYGHQTKPGAVDKGGCQYHHKVYDPWHIKRYELAEQSQKKDHQLGVKQADKP